MEMIIAVAIFGGLSIISVQALWDTLSTRAKQYSIESSTSTLRPILSVLENSITAASQVNVVSATELRIVGATCRTIKLVGSAIVQQVSSVSPPCTAPTSGTFETLTPPNYQVSAFTLSPIGSPDLINIYIKGQYADSLGIHPFEAVTSASSRVAL